MAIQPTIATEFTKEDKFQIEISNPSFGTNNKVNFGAFLKGFKDSYKTNAVQNSTFGRMDPIINYQNTQRSISISFAVPSANLADSQRNMGKILSLISFQYPVFQKNAIVSGINSPPICTMKFENLVQEQGNVLYGYFGGVDYEPVVESGWLITNNHRLYAKEYSVSLQFTVLHTIARGRTVDIATAVETNYESILEASLVGAAVAVASITPGGSLIAPALIGKAYSAGGGK